VKKMRRRDEWANAREGAQRDGNSTDDEKTVEKLAGKRKGL
jgi:hypothetical protein